MLNSIATGRRVALRAVTVQAVAVLAVALAFLPKGWLWMLAASLGGGALVLGNVLAASLALNGVVPARTALARLLLGTLAKWCVVVAVFVVALQVWRLPPLPMLAGLVAGMLVWAITLNGTAGRHGAAGGQLKGGTSGVE